MSKDILHPDDPTPTAGQYSQNWTNQYQEGYQAAVRDALACLPSDVDTDGSTGKWVNGWNDYREKARKAIEEKGRNRES